jgi:hypothetical protein
LKERGIEKGKRERKVGRRETQVLYIYARIIVFGLPDVRG